MVPNIAVYYSEKMDELIKLVEEDRQRIGDHPIYKTKPEGSMNGLVMRWHPLMVPRTEISTTPKHLGGQEGMDNIILVIEDTDMPMMMDALVRIATEIAEAKISSAIEDMFSKVEEQQKKLQFCFWKQIIPRCCAHVTQLPCYQIMMMMVVAVRRVAFQLRKGLSALQMDVDDVGSHAEASASDADGGFASRLDASNVGGAGHEQATSGTDVSSPRTLAAGMHDNIQTLVPYEDSEEEVDLPDDCGAG